VTGLPADVAVLLNDLSSRLSTVTTVVGLYVVGSLSTGDFVPDVSDLDVVAVVAQPLTKAQERLVREHHFALRRAHGLAQKLNCIYVAMDCIADPDTLHLYWYGHRSLRRQLSVIMRAELHANPVRISGRGPEGIIPGIDQAAVRDAVRAELTGYWRTVAGWRFAWLRDFYVDLGLLTLPRASSALSENRLITKREAISRLADFEVPTWLVDEITARRAGHRVHLSVTRRLRRAWSARRLMAEGIRKVLEQPQQ
jgi:hypothetical protein